MKRLSLTNLPGADLVDVRNAIKLHKHWTPWGLGYRVHLRGVVGSLSVNENLGYAVKHGDNWVGITIFNQVIATKKSRTEAVWAVVLHFAQSKEGAA